MSWWGAPRLALGAAGIGGLALDHSLPSLLNWHPPSFGQQPRYPAHWYQGSPTPTPSQLSCCRYSRGGLMESAFYMQLANALLPPLGEWSNG